MLGNGISFMRLSCIGPRRFTFNHPLHLDFTRVKDTLDPSVFPCEELDEFDLREINEQAYVRKVKHIARKTKKFTAVMSSLITPIRLSRAVEMPLPMRNAR